MKILFVGDASNMHNCLAQALRDLGHTAVVASNGSHWMDTSRDIDLKRGPGKMGAVKYVLDVLRALPRMQGFDVVVTCGSIFLDLKPQKVRRVFDWLKRHNRSMVMSALGTDYVYYHACHDGKTYRYSDFMVGEHPSPYALSKEYQAKHEALMAPSRAYGSITHATSRCWATALPMVAYPSTPRAWSHS